MAGKNPHEAVDNFVTPLRQALACVTNEILLVGGGYYPSSSPHAVTLSHNPAVLGRDRRLALTLIQQYRIIEDDVPRGPWKVRTVAYNYTVEEATGSGHEIFAYHWHPRERTARHFPHFHLYQGAGGIHEAVRKAHFPTGRIAIEDVLRLLITEWGVKPLHNDWEAILDRTSAAFQDWRTWS
jgi:hypothetical protein